jgi:hypothetical protein
MNKAYPTVKENLFESLKELKDYRRGQGQRHSLQTILIIVIMAIMSGVKGERAIARFAKNNEEELIELLKIKRKQVPSRSVISGLIQNIDFNQLENIFRRWAMQFISIDKGDWISIDGKAINGTVVNAQDKMQSFVSLVTVFVNKKKQVLSVGKIDTNKESEIQTVQNLINMLDLQGVIFTLDALHCQTKTVETIVSSKNDYVINVKGNQKKLLTDVKKLSKLGRI